jgi:Na+-driven multidrug efflux pump
MWAEALGLCATALAILVFVAPWGLLGAAIASAGGRAAVSIVLLRALRELRRESSALADGMGGSSTTLGLP